jgi:hypothetical protein
MRSSVVCNIVKVIKARNEIGNKCSMHGQNEKYIQTFGQKTKGRSHLDIGSRILKYVLEK